MGRSLAVFLDRDGVLNRSVVREGKPYPPSSIDEFEILPGAALALPHLVEAGYILIGVTNQPDVARGTQSKANVEMFNAMLLSNLPITDILVCYHDNADQCDCRKPKPGLLIRAAEMYDVNLARSWMVGDRWSDIAAGQAAGVRTIFLDNHYSEPYKGPPPDFVVTDTSLITDVILKGQS